MLLLFSGLYGGSAAFLKFIGFGVFLWLARILSVDDFASFGLLYATQQALATFASAGIVESVIGLLKVYQSSDQRTRLFATANLVFFFTALSATFFAMIISVIFLRGKSLGIVSYISIFGGGVLLAWATLQAQLVRLKELHVESLLFSFFPPFGGLFGGFIAVILERTVQSFFMGAAIGILIPVLCLWGSRGGLGGGAAGFDEIRRILRSALPFMVVALMGFLSGYGNNYIINNFFTRGEVAKFTFALSFSSIMLMIAGGLNQVWSPRFFRLIHVFPFEQVEKKNQYFFRVLGFVIGSASGGVIIIFPHAMALMGGNLLSYQHIGLELSFLLAAYVLLIPWWQCQNHFLAHAMGPSVLKITLMTSIVGLTILISLMWLLGPIGVYIGFFTQMLLRSVGILMVARRYWLVEVSWKEIWAGLCLIAVGFALSFWGILLIYSFLFYLTIVAVLAWLLFSVGLSKR